MSKETENPAEKGKQENCQSWTENFNNLNEKSLEIVEEIVNECEDWLIEIIQNKEQWKKLKNNKFRGAVNCGQYQTV